MIRMGKSWPGRKPGTRYWVSGGPAVFGLWWMGRGLGTLPALFVWVLVVTLAGTAWLFAEACVLIASALLLLRKQPGQVHLVNLAWGLTGFERR